MERMGEKPLPSIREALAHDPELRAELRRRVNERAKAADKAARRIENYVWSHEEWFEHQEERGCP